MLGIGAGKIELILPKTAYASGESIDGILNLTIKKQVKARGLYVTLYAEQDFRERDNSMGKTEIKTVQRKIYSFQQALDVEKEYLVSEATPYPFSLVMPPMAESYLADNPLHGFTISLGGIAMMGPKLGPISQPRWFIEGFLDLPLAFDVKAKASLVHL